jgi:guanylate kinase
MNNSSGKLIIFTAPSGAGKTTLVKHILSKNENIDFSISATTRAKRSYEVEAKDYYYLSIETFKAKIANNEFLEWEEVYENQYYGTLRSEIDRIWSTGKAIIFDIDVQGATDLKSQFGDKCITIFVKPPSVDTLIERLRSRNTETEESFNKRVKKIKKEIAFENSFDAVIVNDTLEYAMNEAEIIVSHFLNAKK